MRRLFVAATLITACLLPFPSVSPTSVARASSSRCDLETIGRTEAGTVRLRSIYVSEINGAIKEVCVDVNNAILTISEAGQLSLLQRNPNFEITYFTSGARDGRIRRIGDVSFDYYTSRSNLGKIKRIGNLRFNYYTSRRNIGKLKEIGNLDIDYYTSGSNNGRVEQIGRVSFDYDNDDRIETRGTLSNVNLLIVDLINVINPD